MEKPAAASLPGDPGELVLEGFGDGNNWVQELAEDLSQQGSAHTTGMNSGLRGEVD